MLEKKNKIKTKRKSNKILNQNFLSCNYLYFKNQKSYLTIALKNQLSECECACEYEFQRV